MSRFPEIIEEVIEHVVLEEAFLVEETRGAHRGEIVERQGAGRAGRGSPPGSRSGAGRPGRPRGPGVLGLSRDAAASEPGVRGWPSRRRASTPAPARRASSMSSRRSACSRRVAEATSSGSLGSSRRCPASAGQDAVRRSEARVNARAARRDRRSSMSAPSSRLLKRLDKVFVVEHATFSRASWRTRSG